MASPDDAARNAPYLDASARAAWERNMAVNRTLVEDLEPAMLSARSPGGGATVAQHLAHMVMTVKFWGDLIDPQRMATLPDLFRGEPEGGAPEYLDPETDTERIAAVWRQTAEAALATAAAHPAGGPESPHEGGAAYLVHMLVHDAHHRGQILLALKTAGHPLPDEEAMWAPWRS
ncbi:MAG TPA: DinB family protein [Trueperaceae bacterium]|nr:DinB family protein [Trueperaceae bacterium]